MWEKCGSDFFLIFVVLACLIFHEILHGRLPLVGGGNDGMGPSTGHPEPMRTGYKIMHLLNDHEINSIEVDRHVSRNCNFNVKSHRK